jgi:hypothetical protein
MSKLLTNITTPFGLLDPETAKALKECGGPWEFYTDHGIWKPADDPAWVWRTVYRKAADTKPSIDWTHIAEGWNWLARDADGLGFLYTEKPQVFTTCWMGEGKEYARTHTSYRFGTCDWRNSLISYRPGTCDWRESLICRPGYEGKP